MNEYTTINEHGTKSYYKDKARTIRHREDGPAIEYHNGSKSWYLNGKLHRMDGPAIEIVKGGSAWFINDEYIFQVDNSGKVTDRMK